MYGGGQILLGESDFFGGGDQRFFCRRGQFFWVGHIFVGGQIFFAGGADFPPEVCCL